MIKETLDNESHRNTEEQSPDFSDSRSGALVIPSNMTHPHSIHKSSQFIQVPNPVSMDKKQDFVSKDPKVKPEAKPQAKAKLDSTAARSAPKRFRAHAPKTADAAEAEGAKAVGDKASKAAAEAEGEATALVLAHGCADVFADDELSKQRAADALASLGANEDDIDILTKATSVATDVALKQLRDKQAAAMAFKRARDASLNGKSDPTVDDTAFPKWLAQKIPKKGPGYKYWFEMWLEHGRNVQSCIATEVVRRRMKSKKYQKYEELREDEIFARFPPKVAEAMLREIGKQPGGMRDHPQAPGLKEGRLYQVLTFSGKEQEETYDHEQELRMMMNLDGPEGPGDTIHTAMFTPIWIPNKMRINF